MPSPIFGQCKGCTYIGLPPTGRYVCMCCIWYPLKSPQWSRIPMSVDYLAEGCRTYVCTYMQYQRRLECIFIISRYPGFLALPALFSFFLFPSYGASRISFSWVRPALWASVPTFPTNYRLALWLGSKLHARPKLMPRTEPRVQWRLCISCTFEMCDFLKIPFLLRRNLNQHLETCMQVPYPCSLN